MLNRKGVASEHHWKLILIFLGVLFIAYGYYGYFYVQNQGSMGMMGGGGFCPLGRGQDIIGSSTAFSSPMLQSGPCSFSLTALLIGVVLLAIPVIIMIVRKKF